MRTHLELNPAGGRCRHVVPEVEPRPDEVGGVVGHGHVEAVLDRAGAGREVPQGGEVAGDFGGGEDGGRQPCLDVNCVAGVDETCGGILVGGSACEAAVYVDETCIQMGQRSIHMVTGLVKDRSGVPRSMSQAWKKRSQEKCKLKAAHPLGTFTAGAASGSGGTLTLLARNLVWEEGTDEDDGNKEAARKPPRRP